MKTFIYQHLEMGDNIICNGLIREFCKENPQDNHFLATKHLNSESVRFMYRDLKNLELVLINGTYEIPIVLDQNPYDKFIKVGHGLINLYKHFDEGFYEQHGIDMKKRWSSFKVERDSERENDFYNKFEISSDYAFVHEDASRNMIVTKNINPNLRIIKADRSLTNNIFDYLKLIENAKEIHCIPSSFLFLCDSFDFKGYRFLHKYSRRYPNHGAPTLRLEWNEID